MKNKPELRKFLFTIVFPTILAIVLYAITMFFVFIPKFEAQLIADKRDMLRELTKTTASIFDKHENDVKKGIVTRQEARQRAIAEIETIRYGDENKDYFWITDMKPVMIMHPYRTDLNGKDLSNVADPTGKRLFVEFVKKVKEKGSGYVDYMWQWKDDSSRIVKKVSYVQAYKPWGWVIGTGIYIEDVREEIDLMERSIVIISAIILFTVGVLMFFIMLQSLRIEQKRASAENALRESREKYKTLVEAATEGTLMVMDGKIAYANIPVQKMLGYSAKQLTGLKLSDIVFYPDKEIKKYFDRVENGTAQARKLNARLRTAKGDVVKVTITVSNVQYGIKKGYTVMIANQSKEKIIIEELNKNKERIHSLTDSLNIGLFRTTFGKRGRFIEANPAAMQILGFENKEQLYNKSIFDLFFDTDEKKAFIRDLNREKSIRNRVVRISKEDGSFSVISVSVVVTKDAQDREAFCDGVIEDITAWKKAEDEKESLISELQTSQFFLNQPVKYFTGEVTICHLNESIRQAAEQMSRSNSSIILVCTESGKPIGIITDSDLRKRVINSDLQTDLPVSDIMSSPLVTIDERALIFEVILLMNNKEIRHLPVKNSKGEINGIITGEDLRRMLFQSSPIMLRDISTAKNVYDLQRIHERLPSLIKVLIDSGANAKNINRVMTVVSDAITKKLIKLAIEKTGEPPVEFAFVALGSEGREEQTLKTDQDNAIIFNDVPDEKLEQVNEYFLTLGNQVCTWLDHVGYTFCEGEIMAMNPKWCKPFSVWKQYFTQWITKATPQDLLEVNIFFDFRCLYGQEDLASELRNYIAELTKANPAFFIYMTDNTLLYKPPIGLFGNIVAQSDDKTQRLNIKDAMVPITGLARIYALKHDIYQTNTMQRIEAAYRKKIFQKSTYKEMLDAYKYLMQTRLKHQAKRIGENNEPDNLIDIQKLTSVELSLLKKVFSRISGFQTQLSYDFKGRT